jgi:hypothetical protein
MQKMDPRLGYYVMAALEASRLSPSAIGSSPRSAVRFSKLNYNKILASGAQPHRSLSVVAAVTRRAGRLRTPP